MSASRPAKYRAWAARTSSATPRAASCSSANWRIVSGIENRACPDERSARSSDFRTSAFEVEAAREHRTPLQQHLLRVVEVVVRPGHRVAQGLVACQTAPRSHQEPEALIEAITHVAGGH